MEKITSLSCLVGCTFMIEMAALKKVGDLLVTVTGKLVLQHLEKQIYF
jgi:hypothetical protein